MFFPAPPGEGRTPPTQAMSSSSLPQFSLHYGACVLVVAMCSGCSWGEETADA